MNLIFTGKHLAQIKEVELGIWSDKVGRFEGQILMAQAQESLVAQFTNEARKDFNNVGGLVKAVLIYRRQGQEVCRIVGCWLDVPTDYAEFHVDETRELLIFLQNGNHPKTISKQRSLGDLGKDNIRTDIIDLPVLTDGTVTIRLTNADTGEFLLQQEFTLGLSSPTQTAN